MKVEIRIDPQREEPTLVVEAPALTPQVEEIAQRLREEEEGPLLGRLGEKLIPLKTEELVRFYAQDKGVFAQDVQGESYALRLRLYELEARLDKHTFVRVSNSELVNLKKITALDLSFSGTIKITLEGGAVCYASRRYVKKMKQALGL